MMRNVSAVAILVSMVVLYVTSTGLMFLGSVNTIKAQQKAFQAAKKVSGNTFLTGSASSMMSNYFITAWCFLGCGFACTVGLKNMYYGINKYVVPDDE